MATSYPTFQVPGNALSFVTAAGVKGAAPLQSQISTPLPNGGYLIPGLLNGSQVVMMAYTSAGQGKLEIASGGVMNDFIRLACVFPFSF
jgi:hypothetical protein